MVQKSKGPLLLHKTPQRQVVGRADLYRGGTQSALTAAHSAQRKREEQWDSIGGVRTGYVTEMIFRANY
jgi:hypothetical protein